MDVETQRDQLNEESSTQRRKQDEVTEKLRLRGLELTAQKNDTTALQDHIGTLQLGLQTERDRAKKETSARDGKLQKLNKEQIALSEQLTSSNNELAKRKTENAKFKDQIELLESQIAHTNSLSEKCLLLQRQLTASENDQAIKEAALREAERLQECVTGLEGRLEVTVQHEEALVKDAQQLREELTDLTDQLTTTNNNLQRRHDVAEQVDILHGRIQSLQDQLAEAQGRAQGETNGPLLDETEGLIDSALEEAQTREERFRTLEAELSKSDSERRLANLDNRALRQRIAELENQLSEVRSGSHAARTEATGQQSRSRDISAPTINKVAASSAFTKNISRQAVSSFRATLGNDMDFQDQVPPPIQDDLPVDLNHKRRMIQSKPTPGKNSSVRFADESTDNRLVAGASNTHRQSRATLDERDTTAGVVSTDDQGQLPVDPNPKRRRVRLQQDPESPTRTANTDDGSAHRPGRRVVDFAAGSNTADQQPTTVVTEPNANRRKRPRTEEASSTTTQPSSTPVVTRPQWTIDEVRRPDFQCSLMPAEIVREIQQRIMSWDNTKSSWSDVVLKGKPKCVDRRLRQVNAQLEGDHACRSCISNHQICLRAANGKLEPLPLPPAMRGSSDQHTVHYWKA